MPTKRTSTRHRNYRARTGTFVLDGMPVHDGVRHDAMFDYLRVFGYGLAKDSPTYGALYETILSYGLKLNQQMFLPPLAKNDVRSIARAVARFCWRNRTRFSGRRRVPQDPTVTREHRRDGVARARDIRSNHLLARIRTAEAELASSGAAITISAVSRVSGIRRQTVAGFFGGYSINLTLRKNQREDFDVISGVGCSGCRSLMC